MNKRLKQTQLFEEDVLVRPLVADAGELCCWPYEDYSLPMRTAETCDLAAGIRSRIGREFSARKMGKRAVGYNYGRVRWNFELFIRNSETFYVGCRVDRGYELAH